MLLSTPKCHLQDRFNEHPSEQVIQSVELPDSCVVGKARGLSALTDFFSEFPYSQK
jgi:hypothetical protein